MEEAEQQFIGIGPLTDDLNSRMTAFQPLDRDAGRRITVGRSRFGGIIEGQIGIEPSGASHIEFPLGLGIEIQ